MFVTVGVLAMLVGLGVIPARQFEFLTRDSSRTPASVIERYTRPVLAELWSDARRYETWLRVELAACEAMEPAGRVPAGTAAARARSGPTGKLDPARILEIETRTRHDVIAFLTHVEELAGEPARWLHLGMTSSDVLDASLAILLREAADEILAGVDLLRPPWPRRAREHRGTLMIGRSHGIHAEPITAGLVFAGFFSELERARRGAGLARARRSRWARSPARSAPTPTWIPAIEVRALASAGPAPGDGAHPDRGPRPPRRLLRAPWPAWAPRSSAWR